MAILRSYKCLEHGYFDAWEAMCPHGCLDVGQVIIKAPSMRDSTKAARTKSADTTLKGLSKDFNMTDIKSVKEGEAQNGYLTRNNAKPPEPRAGDAVMWGQGGRFNMASVLGGGAVRSVAGEPVGIRPQDINLTQGPRPDPNATMKDHEGLKIK